MMKGTIGDFDDLYEPIEMHKGLANKNECSFLSHPGQEKLYELDHGLKINNAYCHGYELMLDSD